MALSLIDSVYNPESSFELDLSSELPAFNLKPEEVEMPDLSNLELELNIGAFDAYTPAEAPKAGTTDSVLADFLGQAKASGLKDKYYGALLKTIGSANSLFNSVINFGTQRKIIDMQAENQQQEYKNQMASLDNQVLFAKNRMMDRFNKTVAMNTVNMAAKNLRVSSGNVLDLSKDLAQETTEDMRMAESNAKLQKISLEGASKQTGLAAKIAKNQQISDLIGGAMELGLSVATGGGTMESWGNLHAGYKQAKIYEASKIGNLNKAIY